jgi:hypothetical protein
MSIIAAGAAPVWSFAIVSLGVTVRTGRERSTRWRRCGCDERGGAARMIPVRAAIRHGAPAVDKRAPRPFRLDLIAREVIRTPKIAPDQARLYYPRRMIRERRVT